MRLSGRQRVGILGGTFDPIHVGHLIIAEEAYTQLKLERVLFVPSRVPWRKAGRELAEERDRLAMVRLAVAGNEAFCVSTVDLEREGPSYSVDTVREVVRELLEETDLYFILGIDALMDLPYWREPGQLAELTRLVAVLRPGYNLAREQLERAIPRARERLVLLEVPEVGISSTEIRRRVVVGQSIRYWVPDAVAAYITERRLYAV